jgi:hypothetical protein
MAAHALPLGTEPPGSGIVKITGRYRLPSDVASELKHVLAENPQIVILDLELLAGNSHRLPAVLEPVADYLAAWPGTVIVVGVPDPASAAAHVPLTIIDRVVLDRGPDEGLARARHIVPRQHPTTTHLSPVPQAPEAARAFTRRALRGWRLEPLIWPTSLVVSELVTHSILQEETAIDLTLTSVDELIRIAVHDYGSDNLQIRRLAEPTDPMEDPLHHRGLLVVRALTRCWGVFPSRIQGKTVWAVVEAS